MKEQQERARAAHTKVSAKVATPDTTKLDQSKLVNDETAVKATIAMLGKEGVEISEARDGQEVTIILDDNPFHAEGGGQLSDTGVLCAAEGKAQVTDAQALPMAWYTSSLKSLKASSARAMPSISLSTSSVI